MSYGLYTECTRFRVREGGHEELFADIEKAFYTWSGDCKIRAYNDHDTGNLIVSIDGKHIQHYTLHPFYYDYFPTYIASGICVGLNLGLWFGGAMFAVVVLAPLMVYIIMTVLTAISPI